MIILSHGFKKPQTGDFGDEFFPALEFNIQQLNDHTHNGTDSSKIPASSLISVVSTILSGSFVDQGNGYYRALFTIPSGGLADETVLTAKDPTTKDIIYLKQEKFSPTQVYFFTNTVQNVEVYVGI